MTQQSRGGDVVDRDDATSRVAAAFDAIASIDDPALFIRVADREMALDSLDPDLPLAGLTFAVKNNIDVAGFDTTAGCPSYAFRPDRSAPVVQRLLQAGATCLGVGRYWEAKCEFAAARPATIGSILTAI